MPELPEITVIAGQMNREISGKLVKSVEAQQPKNLNMPVEQFAKNVIGKTVENVTSQGKWLLLNLNRGYSLFINLGMGAELLYFKPKQKLPENAQFKLIFSDKTGFTIHFWWFGYIHLVHKDDLVKHKLTARLGISPVDKSFTLDHFKKLLAKKKGTLKSFILDQKNLAGIGNVYAQDILFKAKLHPSRKIPSLAEKEKSALFKAIQEVLNSSIKLGGAYFELNFYGKRGGFTSDHFLIGYKTGKPCPECGTVIEKIRTGSTASYVCSNCQKEK